MVIAYIVVTSLAAAANLSMAVLDLQRNPQVLTNMAKVDLPVWTLTPLGVLKGLGGVGLVVGMAVPAVGVAAAAGLVAFFVGAVLTHLRAHEYSLQYPGAFLALAVGALALRLATL